MLAYAAFNGTLTRGYTLRSQWLSLSRSMVHCTRGHIAVATTWALGLCCALAREVQGHISVARPHHSRFLLVAVALDLEVDVEVGAQ